MLIPAKAVMEGVIGATWDVAINLFSDDAETILFDLSEVYDIAQVGLEIDGLTTLTPTSGLTIAVGLVTGTLPPATTATAPASCRWRLKLIRLDGGVDFPVGGSCIWQTP